MIFFALLGSVAGFFSFILAAAEAGGGYNLYWMPGLFFGVVVGIGMLLKHLATLWTFVLFSALGTLSYFLAVLLGMMFFWYFEWYAPSFAVGGICGSILFAASSLISFEKIRSARNFLIIAASGSLPVILLRSPIPLGIVEPWRGVLFITLWQFGLGASLGFVATDSKLVAVVP